MPGGSVAHSSPRPTKSSRWPTTTSSPRPSKASARHAAGSHGRRNTLEMRGCGWFASDFAAEIGVRNYPRLAVFSGDLRGAVHARSQWPSPSVEAVRGDQEGDLLAGDRGRDQPGRGRPQVAHRRIDVSTVIGIRRTVKDAALAAL